MKTLIRVTVKDMSGKAVDTYVTEETMFISNGTLTVMDQASGMNNINVLGRKIKLDIFQVVKEVT